MRQYIHSAREIVAQRIGAEPEEIIFTSGATESVNLAMHFYEHSDSRAIIADSSSHDCVYKSADVYFDSHSRNAQCGAKNALDSMICHGYTTNLLCMTLLNNETGAYTNPKPLAEIAHTRHSYLLCDATAAIGHQPINVKESDIDYLCVSGEKIGALSGVGFLYVRTGAPFLPLFNGG